MTDEQIDTMLQMHRYLIKCELCVLVDKINKDREKELLQVAHNDSEWEKFAKWFKMIRDK